METDRFFQKHLQIRRKGRIGALNGPAFAVFVEHVPTSIVILDKNLRYLASSNSWKENYNLMHRPLTIPYSDHGCVLIYDGDGSIFYAMFARVPRLVAGKWITCLFVICLAPVSRAAERQPPNIIIMLADDAGYSDFGSYGSEHIRTPNVDRLAAEGVRFTDFYAAAPNCSPSRAGLLTGRFPSRIGVYNYIDDDSPMHLPIGEVTLAELLKTAGYQTGVFGKWHLNGDIESKTLPQPGDQGFDYWFCSRNTAMPSHLNPENLYRNGKKLGKIEGYACQIVAGEAIQWIRQRDRSKPFFAYIPFHEPHTPIASPTELVARHTEGTPEQRAYYANIENLDLAIGQVLDYLDDNDLRDNTMVVFFSDNGGTNLWSNVPLRGRKSNVWDGGIRVPGVIRWPGEITPSTVNGTPVGAVDLLPTICEKLDIPLPPDCTIDGTSLLPLFEDEAFERETPLFWYFYRVRPSVALRDGDWMLIGYLEKPDYRFSHPLRPQDIPYLKQAQIVRYELYNLREDIAETRDISELHPDITQTLQARMYALHREVISEGAVWDFNAKQAEANHQKR